MSDTVCVQTFRTRIEAQVAKSVLDAATIHSYIQADDAGGMYPLQLSPTTGSVALMVNKKDAKKAHAALQQ